MSDFNTDEPLAFFITWTVYGTWLPGDERGYVQWHEGWRPQSTRLETYAQAQMVEPPARLTPTQRDLVEQTVQRHCTIRGWKCWAVNARSTHVHTVVTAPRSSPAEARDQLKAWCTRMLRDQAADRRQRWWAEGGSTRCINVEDSLERAIAYTRDAQDLPRN